MKKIFLATGNEGKVKEFVEIFNIEKERILTLKDFPDMPETEETGSSFSENALIKARAGAAFSGEITVADDSGLEVEALNGAPGIYSARYGGGNPDHIGQMELLLKELEESGSKNRKARFVCVAAVIFPDGRELAATGVFEGEIGFERRGENGFGYDSIFYLGNGKSVAELSDTEKNRISHRAKAIKNLLSELKTKGWELC